MSAPDTPANQGRYPQPRSQAAGVGFPLIRLVVLLTFATAALVGAAYGPCQGKETGEMALFGTLLEQIQEGDIVVADGYYCSYWQIALLRRGGADVAFRLHQRRRSDCRRGRRLGRWDHVVTWRKPPRPVWMDEATYASLPNEMALREVRVVVEVPGCRTRVLTIVTTLVDGVEYSREDIADLYHQRWHVGLDLRSIKQTLHMEVLTCKTPAMLERELWVHLLGYNLVRQAMMQAARDRRLRPRQLSFAGAVQTLNAFRWLLQCSEGRCYVLACSALYMALSTHRVGDRVGRVEPRRIKRRRQKYAYLRQPRDAARAELLGTPTEE